MLSFGIKKLIINLVFGLSMLFITLGCCNANTIKVVKINIDRYPWIIIDSIAADLASMNSLRYNMLSDSLLIDIDDKVSYNDKSMSQDKFYKLIKSKSRDPEMVLIINVETDVKIESVTEIINNLKEIGIKFRFDYR